MHPCARSAGNGVGPAGHWPMIMERSNMARITMDAGRFDSEASQAEYRGLESGDILYFPVSPPLVSDADRAFLVTQKQVDASYHKNISYRPIEDRLKGIDQDDTAQRERVHAIMRDYSRHAIAFMSTILKQYAGSWKIDFASFRPIEESGARSRCTRGTTCCTSTRSRRVPRTAIGCCGSSRTSTRIGRGSGSPRTTSRRSPASSPSGSGCIASRGAGRMQGPDGPCRRPVGPAGG